MSKEPQIRADSNNFIAWLLESVWASALFVNQNQVIKYRKLTILRQETERYVLRPHAETSFEISCVRFEDRVWWRLKALSHQIGKTEDFWESEDFYAPPQAGGQLIYNPEESL